MRSALFLVMIAACDNSVGGGTTGATTAGGTTAGTTAGGTTAGTNGGTTAGTNGGTTAGTNGGTTAGTNGGTTGGTGNGCNLSSDCAGGLVCDHQLGVCVECRASSDCGANQVCQNHQCQAATPCQSDLQCHSLNMVCDTKAGRCVECNGAADCPLNTTTTTMSGQACLGHSCVAANACTSSLQCGKNLVCATADPPAWPGGFLGKGCAECGSQADCPPDEACQEGLCVKVCYQANAKCGTVAGATCGTCANGMCASTGSVCMDPIGGGNPFGFGGGASEGLVVTPDAVYTATRDSTSYVYRTDRKSGSTTPAAVVSGYLNTLTENSTDLFWGEGEHIYKMSKSGGSATAVHTFNMGDDCYSVAADDQNAYCHINQSTPAWFGIYQVPLAGGNPIALTPTNQEIDIDRMISRNGKLFWSSFNDQMIAVTPIGGGNYTSLAHVQVNDFAVDDNFVYFGTASGISKAPVGGGATSTLASLPSAGNSEWQAQLLVGNYLYVSGASLVKVDVGSGKVVTLLGSKDGGGGSLASDGKAVFISNSMGVFQLEEL
jgi:hypothetical protein